MTDNKADLPQDFIKHSMLRMRDLIEKSGLSRQTIHYYNNEGLLPPPYKVRKNSALYGPEHIERLQQIKTLREEHFLPIKAIKAIFNHSSKSQFSLEQLDYIQKLKLRFPDSVNPGDEEYILIDNACPENITQQDLDMMEQLNLIEINRKDGAKVTKEDVIILESWAQFKKLGLNEEKGYDPSFLNIWDKAIEQLVIKEFENLAPLLAGYQEDELVDVGNEIISIINQLIKALHYKKTRQLFEKLNLKP